MEPVVDPFLASGSLGLRYLVGVMDRDVVDSATVYVEVFAQVFHAHGTALQMPARVAFSPGGIPDHGVVLEL